jgi:hypothetical protein
MFLQNGNETYDFSGTCSNALVVWEAPTHIREAHSFGSYFWKK